MKPKLRNALSTLCLLYVRAKDPFAFKTFRYLVEENYKSGSPRWTASHVYREYEKIASQTEVTGIL
jgi:hypothetical protein